MTYRPDHHPYPDHGQQPPAPWPPAPPGPDRGRPPSGHATPPPDVPAPPRFELEQVSGNLFTPSHQEAEPAQEPGTELSRTARPPRESDASFISPLRVVGTVGILVALMVLVFALVQGLESISGR